MSARDRRPEALVLDPGVLREGPVCEFGSSLAVAAQGGTVVTPWRDLFRAAEIAELSALPHARDLPAASFSQVIVHIQKGRAATYEDLADAWRVLEPGGQFLVAGTNALGVTSAVKKLAGQLDQTPIVVTNRARARVVRFKRDDGHGPEREETPSFDAQIQAIDGTEHAWRVETLPGVFSARKLDAGSQLLLGALPRFIGHKPPKRIVDLGCGTGVLAIAAATLYPEAECVLADADARAVECARSNIERLGLSERCRVEWWDAREAPLGDRFQLALVNPPFHQHGPDVDLGPALALFDSLSTWLGRNGRALVVANRTLPYEAPLAQIGEVETLESAKGYKLFSLKKSGRSSGTRGRSAPGSRSEGRSKRPMRSR
jgi:16S rRNA (guanine1207-N2)-methyltransferase